MRLTFRITVYATALLVLAMLAVIGDLVLNKRRLFYAMLGRDGVVAACMPVLTGKLRDAGFEPAELELGDTPDITISTAAGKTLQDTFTFADGASATRVDGIVACALKGTQVTLEFRTLTTPTRAT